MELDGFEILKAFGNICFVNEDNTRVKYKMITEEGFIFYLSFLSYDHFASVMLMRPDEESWLSYIAIDDIKEIVYKENSLYFYKNENPKKSALTVTIKPKISLTCRAAAPQKV